MKPTVYIILPVFNREQATASYIQTLHQQTFDNWHLILVDDNSQDSTVQTAERLCSKLSVVRGDGNLWWAGGLQKGIEFLEQRNPHPDDIVLLSNNDIRFELSFLEAAVEYLAKSPNTLLLPWGFDARTNEVLVGERGLHFDYRTLKTEDCLDPDHVNCLSTRALFMHWKTLQRVGGFRPRLLPHYFSDYEFTLRAHRKGCKLVSSDALQIRIDREQTGLHSLRKFSSFTDKVRFVFSKRYSYNPIYLTVFTFLSCPLPYALKHLFAIWSLGIKSTYRWLKRISHERRYQLP